MLKQVEITDTLSNDTLSRLLLFSEALALVTEIYLSVSSVVAVSKFDSLLFQNLKVKKKDRLCLCKFLRGYTLQGHCFKYTEKNYVHLSWFTKYTFFCVCPKVCFYRNIHKIWSRQKFQPLTCLLFDN